MWYRSTDRRCRAGAPMQNLSHSASFHRWPNITPASIEAFRAGTARVAALDCDIAIAPHPGAVVLRARVSGQRPLTDRTGCRVHAATASERLDKRLAAEAGGG